MARVPPELVVTNRVRVPGAEIDLSFARSGGPGGQHVNKTESKVVLRWNARASVALSEEDRALLGQRLGPRLTTEGDLVLAVDSHRDQHRNVEEALDRFVRLLRDALHRPKPRRKTKPSRSSRERRLQSKKRRSQLKRDRRGD
jgi:ribosome-associated protein